MLNRFIGFLIYPSLVFFGCKSDDNGLSGSTVGGFIVPDSSTITFVIDTSDVVVNPDVAVNEGINKAVLFSAADNAFIFYELAPNKYLIPSQRISFPMEGENSLGKNDSYDVKYTWLGNDSLVFLNKKYSLLYIIDIKNRLIAERIKLTDYLDEGYAIKNDNNIQFQVFDSLLVLNISPGRFNPNKLDNAFDGPLFAVFNFKQRSFTYFGKYTSLYKRDLWGSNLSLPNYSFGRLNDAFYYALPLHDSVWMLSLQDQQLRSVHLRDFPSISRRPLGIDGMMGGLVAEVSHYVSQAKIVYLRLLYFNNQPFYWLTFTQPNEQSEINTMDDLNNNKLKARKPNLELLYDQSGITVGKDTLPPGLNIGYFQFGGKVFLASKRDSEERIVFRGFQIDVRGGE